MANLKTITLELFDVDECLPVVDEDGEGFSITVMVFTADGEANVGFFRYEANEHFGYGWFTDDETPIEGVKYWAHFPKIF